MSSSDDVAGGAGGEWIGGEFYARGGIGAPAGCAQTRDEALYGPASSDDDTGGGRRGKRRRRDGDADLSAPVGFVSAGAAAGASAPSPPRPGLGAGRAPSPDAPPSRAGLGAGRPGLGAAVPPRADEPAADNDGVLPGAFGRRIMAAAAARAAAAKDGRGGGGAGGAVRSQAPPPPPRPPAADIGAFEKHTKGIGAKLLAKMGYVPGQGLGRDGGGIARPVEAVQRPKGAGLGVGGGRKPAPDATSAPPPPRLSARAKAAAETAATQREIDAAAAKAWRKRDAAAARAAKPRVRTAADVVAAAGGPAAPGGSGPILDMRGTVPVLVADAGALGVGVGGGGHADDVPLPDLQHNLRLLVDLAASDVARLDGVARAEEDTATALEAEVGRCERGGEAARAAAGAAAGLAERARAARSARDPAAFTSLKAESPADYAASGLAVVAGAAALPSLAAAVAAWEPLRDDEAAPAAAATAAAWRSAAETHTTTHPHFDGCPYTTALGATVLPRAAAALATRWKVHDPTPALAFFDVWECALPPTATASLIDTTVTPVLTAAVEAWDPATDATPIHAWLHPWLSVAPRAIHTASPRVRHKLASALTAWHPSDGSALALLRPWHGLWSREAGGGGSTSASAWDVLVERSVVPRLASVLTHDLAISPASQDLTPWHWVTAWAPLLRPSTLERVLVSSFFPAWHAALRAWLAAPSVDLGEVAAWYEGWKALLPPTVADTTGVRTQLAAGVDAMNVALAGGDVGALPPPPAAASVDEGARPRPPPPTTTAPAPPPPPNMRALVEAFAEDAGLALVPCGPAPELGGRPTYTLGRVRVALDAAGGGLEARVGGAWVAASLEDVLAEHERREKGGGGGG